AIAVTLSQHTARTTYDTLSLHDALPISRGTPTGQGLRRRRGDDLRDEGLNGRGPPGPRHRSHPPGGPRPPVREDVNGGAVQADLDRKSTRLNSSHVSISYAVFCLKKKTT